MGNMPRGRLVLGHTEAGWALSGPEHGLLVLGPPRSGKTTGVIVPNVRVAPGAVVSTSTKRDVLLATAADRARLGTCWLYDPSGAGPTPSGVELLRWSPIPAALDWDAARKAAGAMVAAARPDDRGDSAFWSERAGTMLGPLLHAAALSERPMRQVVHWADQMEASTAIAILETAGADMAVSSVSGVVNRDAREQSGVWSTISSILSPYRSEAALETTVGHNFDADAFVRSNDTIYVCSTGREQSGAAPLIVGLLEEIREARYRLSDREGETGRETLLFALDEVANIAPLPKLPQLVSEGAGQGVLTLACLQDLSQARRRWGAEADGFLTLFGAKLLLPGVADVRTLEAVSALIGQHDVPVPSTSRTGWLKGRRSWSTRRQPRLAVDELRRGRPGCALVLESDREPGWVALVPRRARERSGPAQERGLEGPGSGGRGL